MSFARRLSLLLSLFLIPLAANAQQNITSTDQAAAGRANAEQNRLQEQQRQANRRDAVVSAPGTRSAAPARQGWPELPGEKLCFKIQTFVLEVPRALPAATRAAGASSSPFDRFAFAREWLEHYRGQCVGRQGLDILVKGVQGEILSRGYVTTRVLLPPQDLSTGVLKFALVPGMIRHLKFADAATRGTWKTAFPTRDGDVLQLRDLEQGLEQMKRVPNQDVTMQIVPGNIPGESDVVISVKRTKPWSFVVSADNSGVPETGRYIGSATLGLNNLMGLNDVLTLGYNQDLAFASGMGTQGWNASYAMPWGYWTGTLFGYTNNYSQQIAGINQAFTASGNTQTAGLKIERVLHRGQDDVSGMEFQFIKRFGASFINDTEIPQQYRDNTYVEAGLTNRHYFGASQFDGTLAYRQGIGGFGAMPDTQSGPTYRFHMTTLDGNLSVPFSIGKQSFRYVGTVHGQYTDDELNYLDDLTLGSRYTVRGFTGETMLAAEKGFYWRNELQMPLGASGQTLYAGLDYGQVWGPSAAYLAGTRLAGAVIGLRGQARASLGVLSYDLFVGTPVYKPANFAASKVVLGFQITAQF